MKEQLIEVDARLLPLFSEDRIFFLDRPERQIALETMSSKLAALEGIDQEMLSKALAQREEVVSTGIGLGIAIPHARIDISNFSMGVGISKAQDGIEWPSLDGLPVRLVFMIVGPKEAPSEFLKLLSSLTHLLKFEGVRKIFMESSTGQELLSKLQDLTSLSLHDKKVSQSER